MINGQKLVVVLPAYNAEQTLERTFREIPLDIVDAVVLVDDCSIRSHRGAWPRRLGIDHIIQHEQNRGYGGNQKSCYDQALAIGADIVVMLHPDYQYTPRLIPAMASIIAQDLYPVAFGSRILGKGARRVACRCYKYLANRVLTLVQNLMLGQKLSEYHTGYRAYSAKVLQKIRYHENSDNFVFDNEVISQIFMAGSALPK